MYSLLRALLLSFIVLSLTPERSVAAQSAWSIMADRELAVTAEFPQPPPVTRQMNKLSNGVPYETITYRVDVGETSFQLIVSDYAGDITQDLQVYARAQASGSKGELFSSRAATVSGYPAVETVIDIQATKLRGYTRTVVVGRRLYQAIVFGPAGADAAASLRFIRSMAIGVAENVVPPAVIAQAAPAPQVPVAPQSFASGPRLALLIGNSAYGPGLGALPNPVNDVDLLAAALRQVGFQVEVVRNADQVGLKRAISRFGERLAAAGRSATGLFFYAGHGVQSRGINYLIPVNALIEREADVDLEAVAADTVLSQMEEAGTGTNIVILDACRNMPLTRSFRSAGRGLARMDAPNGSFVAYSTAPGSVAADGDGRNSPFAIALAQAVSRKGQPIEVVFRDVRRTVLETTGGRQTPWDSSSLIAPFYFVGE